MKTQTQMVEAVCDYLNTEILEDEEVFPLDLLDTLASLGLALTDGNVSEDYVAAIKDKVYV